MCIEKCNRVRIDILVGTLNGRRLPQASRLRFQRPSASRRQIAGRLRIWSFLI
jgi:hypothetical protein